MAKKGNRVQVILECTEHKDSGMPGTSRYITTKNRDSYPSGYPAYFTRSQLTSQVESVVIPYFEFLLPPRFNKM